MLNCCTNALGLCCNWPWSTWSSVIKTVLHDVSEKMSKSPVQWVCLRQSMTLLEEEFLIWKLLLRETQTLPHNSQKLLRALTELKQHSHFSLCKLSWTQYLGFSYFHYLILRIICFNTRITFFLLSIIKILVLSHLLSHVLLSLSPYLPQQCQTLCSLLDCRHTKGEDPNQVIFLLILLGSFFSMVATPFFCLSLLNVPHGSVNLSQSLSHFKITVLG